MSTTHNFRITLEVDHLRFGFERLGRGGRNIRIHRAFSRPGSRTASEFGTSRSGSITFFWRLDARTSSGKTWFLGRSALPHPKLTQPAARNSIRTFRSPSVRHSQINEATRSAQSTFQVGVFT